MIVDFREPGGEVIRGDICIVGAGAAGIAMAWELADGKLKVVVLESGGLDHDGDTQSLYDGENVGLDYYGLESARMRMFGGTTNHWSGWCMPLDALDFEARPWVPLSGWDLTKGDLLPYYRRAQPIFDLGPFDRYAPATWKELDLQPVPLDERKLVTQFTQQREPPVVFGQAYRDELEAAANVTVYLFANLAHIQLSPDGRRVAHLDVASLSGRRRKVVATRFVLACGGLENPRLLLNSDDAQPGGVGNGHDLVGRCFMEHPEVVAAEVFEAANNDIAWMFDWFRHVDARAVVCPSERLQESEGILNTSAHLRAEYSRVPGLAAERQIGESVQNGQVPDELGDKILDVVGDLDDIAAAGWSWLRGGNHHRYRKVERFHLEIHCEQAPNPDSRVVLSEEVDALGLRKINLDWRLTDAERRSIEVLTRTVASEFGRLGLARLRQSEWLASGGDWADSEVEGGYHHMGTTRMADDPTRGVVDRDCKVHGVENLYIAGSSVFPTGGWANPTLTIVALALRLADHLTQLGA